MIHETAVIDPGAQIGKDVQVWHFSHVMPGAHIGDGCILGQNVFVGGDVRIGKRCRIQNNVSVYAGVTLEDDVFVGPSAVFTNIKRPRAGVVQRPFLPTLVKQGAVIGANATIICGVTIGAGAFVAAGAVVTKDVPDGVEVMGVPAVSLLEHIARKNENAD